MTRLTNVVTALYALSSLPLISAWTFTWQNGTDTTNTTVRGTGGKTCETIYLAKDDLFEFDPDDSLVRLHLYESASCTGTAEAKYENALSRNASSLIRGFAVINLSGATTSSSGELEPFPGADWFKSSPNSAIVTAMGKRLVEEGCGEYTQGPGPQWSEADRKSYQCWQEKLGYTGNDADGWPGTQSWDQLKVPLTESSGSSTTTEVPSSTSSSTGTSRGTPTPTGTSVPDASSGSSLGGGEIAGIVIGVVVGLGLIGAIVYLARRVGRRKASGGDDAVPEPDRQPEPEDGGAIAGAGAGGDGSPVAAEPKLMEKWPIETEAIAAKSQKQHFAELPGDTATAELSDSRRINELSDSRRINELSDSQRLVELGDGRK